MKLRFGISLCYAICCTFAFGDEGFTIKHVPKVGDIHKYRQAGKFDVNGMEIEFSSLSTQKVIKVADDGAFTVREDVSEAKANGSAIPDSTGQQGNSTTFSSRGEVIKIENTGGDDTVYRFANLGALIAPEKKIAVGGSWSYEIKENKATGVVPATAKYTLVGEEKLGATNALKIKFTVIETVDGGATSDGEIWISKEDYTMLKLAAKWLNAPVSGGHTVSGNISVTLVQ